MAFQTPVMDTQDEVEVLPSIFEALKLNAFQPNCLTINGVKVEEKVSSKGSPFTLVSFHFDRDVYDPRTGERVYRGDYKETARVWCSIFLRKWMTDYQKLVDYYTKLSGYVNLFSSLEGMEDKTQFKNGRINYKVNLNSLSVISMYPMEEEIIRRIQEANADTIEHTTDPVPVENDDEEDDRPF